MTKKEKADFMFTRWCVIFLLFVTTVKENAHAWEKYIAVFAAVMGCVYALRALYFTFTEAA